jgi:peptide chain release factor 1
MKQRMTEKLESIAERREELDALLSTLEIINDQNKYRACSLERAEIDPVVNCFIGYQQLLDNLVQAEELYAESEAEMRDLALEEINDSKKQISVAESELESLLIPKDPADDANIFLEIRAGTGGDDFGGTFFAISKNQAGDGTDAGRISGARIESHTQAGGA